MFHRKKHEHSPVTIEELVELSKDGSAKPVHGLSLWLKVSGESILYIFDKETLTPMTRDNFIELQARRARARACRYPNGRRKPRLRRHSFA